MHRVLLVLRGELDATLLRQRCEDAVAEDDEMAICYVLPEATVALARVLRAQRDVTAELRRVLGGRAEQIPVFVADDDGIDTCAKDWGATIVRA